MQYRNTPIKGAGGSLAQLMLGRSIRDSVPQPRSAYKISTKWVQLLRQREKALHESAASHMERTENRPTLDELPVGTEVDVQNTDSNEWDRGGLVVEVCPYRQYKVKMKGSGRISLRNRIHLRLVHVFRPSIGGAQARVPTPMTYSPGMSGQSSGEPEVSRPTSYTGDSSSHTQSSSSYQPSSYQLSSSDISSQITGRSRSPMVARREVRKRQEPYEYTNLPPRPH